MPKMIERLQFEVDRFELYTGLRPTRLVVAPDVLVAFAVELSSLISPAFRVSRCEFNGYPVEADPKLPVGAVLVDSERGPMYPLPPPKRAALPAPPAGDSGASPRPWRITDSDPCIIHDANGGLVAALWSRVRGEGRGRADAALIVAAVNAAWRQKQAEAELARSNGVMRAMQRFDLVVVKPGETAHRIGPGSWLVDQPPQPGKATMICVLPLGHSGPCVPAELGPPFGPTGPPRPFSREERNSLHRADCALPLTHSGPCIAAGPACTLSGDCGGREGHAGPCQPMPCPRDPVCDQRAGHEGPCRYEFPAGPPVACCTHGDHALCVIGACGVCAGGMGTHCLPAGPPKLPVGLADPPRGCVPGCIRSLGHEGSCVPPAAPASDVGQELAGYAQAEGKARALSSDCRLPLRHAVGCECGRL